MSGSTKRMSELITQSGCVSIDIAQKPHFIEVQDDYFKRAKLLTGSTAPLALILCMPLVLTLWSFVGFIASLLIYSFKGGKEISVGSMSEVVTLGLNTGLAPTIIAGIMAIFMLWAIPFFQAITGPPNSWITRRLESVHYQRKKGHSLRNQSTANNPEVPLQGMHISRISHNWLTSLIAIVSLNSGIQ